MDKKKYNVSNVSAGTISILGRVRMDFPGKSTVTVEFPAETASRTIAILKQRYPVLQFKVIEEKHVAKPVETTVQPAVTKNEQPAKDAKKADNASSKK